MCNVTLLVWLVYMTVNRLYFSIKGIGTAYKIKRAHKSPSKTTSIGRLIVLNLLSESIYENDA